jgi:hypothetical protein
MFNLKFIIAAVASITGAVAIFGLFLIGAFHMAQLSVSSTSKNEWLYLAACFCSSLILTVAILHRAQLKFEAHRISIAPLTYFFMATALSGFLWSVSFFSWCAMYHSNEFLHHSVERYFKTAFSGSILGSFLLGLLALYLLNPRLRSQRRT